MTSRIAATTSATTSRIAATTSATSATSSFNAVGGRTPTASPDSRSTYGREDHRSPNANEGRRAIAAPRARIVIETPALAKDVFMSTSQLSAQQVIGDEDVDL